MAFRIAFSPSSASDLESIAEFIAADDEEAARRVCKQLYDLVLSLGSNPELGRVTPAYSDPSIRDIVKGHYRIVYRVKSDQRLIEIIRFWHGARGYLADAPNPSRAGEGCHGRS